MKRSVQIVVDMEPRAADFRVAHWRQGAWSSVVTVGVEKEQRVLRCRMTFGNVVSEEWRV